MSRDRVRKAAGTSAHLALTLFLISAHVAAGKPDPNLLKAIMQHQWWHKGKPAEFLPSVVTKCRKSIKAITCITQRLKRDSCSAMIHYQVKSLINDFTPSGKFVISFRTNYIFVLPYDADDPGNCGRQKLPGIGWSRKKTMLTCGLYGRKEVVCYTDNRELLELSPYKHSATRYLPE